MLLFLLLLFVPPRSAAVGIPYSCNCSETAPFVTQIWVLHPSFNKKGCNFVTLGQISENNVAMRGATILNLVLKF